MARSSGRMLEAIATGGTMDARGCGCQGCATLVFLTLVGVTWVIAHKRQIVHGTFAIAIAIAILCFAYLLLTRVTWSSWRGREAARNPAAGPVPLADVKPGMVHTTGLVGMRAATLHTPFDNHACVFFQVTVEGTDGSTIYSARSADELLLEDGGGAKLLVKLEGAKWKLGRVSVVEDGRVAAFLLERGLSGENAARARIEWIEPHELVFVRGEVAKPDEGSEAYRASQASELVMTSPTITLDDAK